MFIRISLVFLLACLVQPMAWGQTHPPAARASAPVKAGDLSVQVQFYGEGIVRIVKWLRGGSTARPSLVVVQNEVPPLQLDVQDGAAARVVSSKALQVSVSKQDGRITFRRPSGEVVLEEAGKAALAPVEFRSDEGWRLQQRFTLTPSEGIFGLGQHQDGAMNYRGRSVTLVQANTGREKRVNF